MTVWIRRRKDAPIMALVLDHLSLIILGVNLGRKQRTTLVSNAAAAASMTLTTLTATSSLELALLSRSKSFGLVVLLLLHLHLEQLLHWESNMGIGGNNVLVGRCLSQGWLGHGHHGNLVLQNCLVLHNLVECRGDALVVSGD